MAAVPSLPYKSPTSPPLIGSSADGEAPAIPTEVST